MRTISHKDITWHFSEVDGGWRTGQLLDLSAAKKIGRLWRDRVFESRNVSEVTGGRCVDQFQGLLHKEGIFFNGEVIDLTILKDQDDKSKAMLYLHVNRVV